MQAKQTNHLEGALRHSGRISRLLATLVAFLIVSSLLATTPAFAYSDGDAPRENNRSYRFSELDVDSDEIEALYEPARTQLPASFDMREIMDIPVANQDELGLCDSFATVKCAETNYALRSGEFIDLSERYLDYMTSRYLYGDDREPGAIPTAANNYEGSEGDGAFNPEILSILEAFGAPSETDVPYGNYPIDQIDAISNVSPALRTTASVTFPSIVTIEDAALRRHWEDVVKAHLMTYGSINSVIDTPVWDETFNPETNAHFYKSGITEPSGGHAISIVGWDDAYSKENFLVEPSRDGAWIALNSWGEDFGEGGFFYISYDDDNCLSQAFGVLDTEVPPAYRKLSHGKNLFSNTGFALPEDGRFFGVRFAAPDPGEKLSHITAGAGGMSSEVFTAKVRCYLNPLDDSFEKDKLVFLGESNTVLEGAGAFFNLQEPIALESSSFALVFEVIGDEDDITFISSKDAAGEPVIGNMFVANSLDGTWKIFAEEFPVHAFTIRKDEPSADHHPLTPDMPDPADPDENEGSGDYAIPDLPEPAYDEPEGEVIPNLPEPMQLPADPDPSEPAHAQPDEQKAQDSSEQPAAEPAKEPSSQEPAKNQSSNPQGKASSNRYGAATPSTPSSAPAQSAAITRPAASQTARTGDAPPLELVIALTAATTAAAGAAWRRMGTLTAPERQYETLDEPWSHNERDPHA